MKNSYYYVFFYLSFIFLQSTIFAKKILVTGGAGFIGSHVVEHLLKRGDSIVIVDNLNDGYDVQLKYYNLSTIEKQKNNSSLKFYQSDICDVEQMEEIFNNERPEVVCHLAARAGVRTSIIDPYECLRTNIIGTGNILHMCHRFSVQHLVCASSSTVYGVQDKSSFVEDELVDCQLSPYGATKRAGELLAYVYHHLYGMSITNLRFFSVYGPRGRVDMAPFIFMDAIYQNKTIIVYGDGSVIRDFTYIDDIVDGIVRSIDNPLGYQVLNLGRGEPVSLVDFIHVMENVIQKKACIHYGPGFIGDSPKTHADITKARNIIGYNPCVSINDGICRMYQWYKNEYLNYRDYKRSIDTSNIVVCFI